jgi:K+-sensing histidine kinase KdpD
MMGPMDLDGSRSGSRRDMAWLAASLLGPFALAAVCIPFRSSVARTNLALVLVVTVVLAASGGRRLPGVLAAISAGVGFDVFLTRPYYSLTISRRDDFTTMLFLVVVGLLVGEISTRTRRARFMAATRAGYLRRLQRIGEMATHAPSLTVASQIAAEIGELLPVAACRYEPDAGGHRRLPTLEPDGTVLLESGAWSVLDNGFPDEIIEIRTDVRTGGRFLVVPLIGIPVDPERLSLALSLVDRFRVSPP